jgi:hypothetical protein
MLRQHCLRQLTLSAAPATGKRQIDEVQAAGVKCSDITTVGAMHVSSPVECLERFGSSEVPGHSDAAGIPRMFETLRRSPCKTVVIESRSVRPVPVIGNDFKAPNLC